MTGSRFRQGLAAALLIAAATGCGVAASSSSPTAAAPITGTAWHGTHAAPARPAALTARRYVFPIRGCRVSYGHSHHDYPATDIFAARGCAFVAPTSGVVDEVSATDRWRPSVDAGSTRGGLSVSVIGTDGVRYYGSHLSTIARGIVPGAHVLAGQQLGAVGDTGDARGTGTHLHFGLSWPTPHGTWWIRRGVVYPWPYLDAWRRGVSRSPAPEVQAAHRRLGDVPPCRVTCR